MITLHEASVSILHLFFPRCCAACGNDVIIDHSPICLSCLSELPLTDFHMHAGNPVEKKFWGRLPVFSATAQYYFTPDSVIQQLMHELKYDGNKELGIFFGILMGKQFIASNRFSSIDALVPLPLFKKKEKQRGFNQARLLCEGIAEIMRLPILSSSISRKTNTETQTRKGRIERWLNMEGKFEVEDHAALMGRHILLVDDIITTGATLEACGKELLGVNDLRLSIAALCYSS
jgi:ComF family protein